MNEWFGMKYDLLEIPKENHQIIISTLDRESNRIIGCRCLPLPGGNSSSISGGSR